MKKTHDETGKLAKSNTLINAKMQQNATKKWERSPRQRHCARSYSVRRTDARKNSKNGRGGGLTRAFCTALGKNNGLRLRAFPSSRIELQVCGRYDLDTNFLEKNFPSRKDLRGSDKIPRMKGVSTRCRIEKKE